VGGEAAFGGKDILSGFFTNVPVGRLSKSTWGLGKEKGKKNQQWENKEKIPTTVTPARVPNIRQISVPMGGLSQNRKLLKKKKGSPKKKKGKNRRERHLLKLQKTSNKKNSNVKTRRRRNKGPGGEL